MMMLTSSSVVFRSVRSRQSLHQPLAVVNAQDRIGVSDVNHEQHCRNSFSNTRVQTSKIASMILTAARALATSCTRTM